MTTTTNFEIGEQAIKEHRNINEILPDAILCEIFENLSTAERAQARYVCRKWARLMRPRWPNIPDTYKVVYGGNLTELRDSVRDCCAERSFFSHVELQSLESGPLLRELLELIGPYVHYLCVRGLSSYELLNAAIFPNLRSLSIDTRPLSKIKQQQQKQPTFELAGFTKLHSLDCLACMDATLYWSIFKQLKCPELRLQLQTLKFRCVLRRMDVMGIIARHAATLRHLELALTLGTDEELVVFGVVCRRLCSLRVLVVHSMLTPKALDVMLENLPAQAPLRELSTAGELESTATLNKLLSKWPSTLEKLRLRPPSSWCAPAHLSAANVHFNYERLHTLEIYRGLRIPRAPIFKALVANPVVCRTLRHLSAPSMMASADEQHALAQLLRSVQLCTLINRNGHTSHEVLQSVIECQGGLQTWHTGYLPRDDELTLREALGFIRLRRLREFNLELNANKVLQVLSMPKLRVLHLRHVNDLTVEQITANQSVRGIGELHISNSEDWNCESFFVLLKMLPDLRGLRLRNTIRGTLRNILRSTRLHWLGIDSLETEDLVAESKQLIEMFKVQLYYKNKQKFWDKRLHDYDMDDDFCITYI